MLALMFGTHQAVLTPFRTTLPHGTVWNIKSISVLVFKCVIRQTGFDGTQEHPSRLIAVGPSHIDHVHHRDILVPKASSSFRGAPCQYIGKEDTCCMYRNQPTWGEQSSTKHTHERVVHKSSRQRQLDHALLQTQTYEQRQSMRAHHADRVESFCYRW